MKNVAFFMLALFMAFTVNAQSSVDWPTYNPFVSSPYYYGNRDVLPTRPKAPALHQNDNVLYRDAMISVMLRELKENSKRLAETNVAVENVKRQMTELENELAQIKKSAKEKDEADSLRNESNEKVKNANRTTTTLAQFVANKLGNFTLDYNDGGAPTARFCNCLLFQQMTSILSKDLAETKVKLNDLTTQIDGNISPKSIGKIPTSCGDLKQLGYKTSGIFSIKGNKRVESVYCDFTKSDNDTDFEKLIGIADVKTTRISFHAQLSTSYTTAQSTVPFDVIVTNVGGGMSTTTGIFTALVTGTYFFALTGVCSGIYSAKVKLQKKGASGSWDSIGLAYGESTKDTFAIQSIVSLSKGDEVRAYLDTGEIYDDVNHYTNFVGFLLEEELV